MTLEIISPEGVLVSTDTEKVFFPGEAGAFEVLRNHAPIISNLTKGKIRYEEAGQMKEIVVGGGFVKVKDNIISVCTEN